MQPDLRVCNGEPRPPDEITERGRPMAPKESPGERAECVVAIQLPRGADPVVEQREGGLLLGVRPVADHPLHGESLDDVNAAVAAGGDATVLERVEDRAAR